MQGNQLLRAKKSNFDRSLVLIKTNLKTLCYGDLIANIQQLLDDAWIYWLKICPNLCRSLFFKYFFKYV